MALFTSLALLVLAGPAAPAQTGGQAERCARLIKMFDDVVVTARDHRLLAIEDVELAEARALRRNAEAECAAGRFRFGLLAIEEALQAIGIVLPAEPRSPPD